MLNMLLSEIIKLKGLDPKNMRIVRHKVKNYTKDLIASGDFDLYQATQKKDKFKDCTHFVSCLDMEGSKAIFWGIYKVNSKKEITKLSPQLVVIEKEEKWAEEKPPYYFYDIERLDILDEYKERLIIEWDNPRNWVQTNLNKEIVEILPPGFFGPFPGYQEVILTFEQLATIINNPDSNRQWKMMLSNVFGVYLILDKENGKQYVGKASGKEGIWGRWTEYVKTKDGHNKGMAKHLEGDPERYNNFQFSIMAVLPNSSLDKDVDRLEAIIKRKIGSREFGLNEN